MQPFLALITPIGGGQPDQGLPGPQPQPPIAGWGPGFPTNPIAPGGPPPGIWGPGSPIIGNLPSLPGGQPPIGSVPLPPGINIPVFPGNLPVIPGQGGGGGGGSGGAKPDQSLPGDQPSVGTLPSGSFILVWSPQYGWILVAQGGQPPISQGPGAEKPDQSLPGSQPKPDQGLPGNQPKPGQELPPAPPHAQPKK